MQKTILVLEDSLIILSSITKILEKANYKVITARNGKEGLMKLDKKTPDLIISDIIMPEIDGFEFCKIVRNNSATKFTPFIFLTSQNNLKDKIYGLEMGADDYLVKPFNQQELLTRVSVSLRKIEALMKLSHEDALTGVANRRYFQENLNREIKRNSRQKTLFCVVILDIDYFKEFNDTYGHKMGDIVLVEFTKFIKKRIRESDFFARYGGEEFTLILPDTNKEGAVKLLDQLIKELSSHKIANPFNKKEKLNITFSAGISEFPTDGQTREDIIMFADKKLYKAKEAGRNRVC